MASVNANMIIAASDATIKFTAQLSTITTMEGLKEVFGTLVRLLGFDVFVLGQMPAIGYEGSNFYLTNYPEQWTKEVYSRFKFGDDPVLDAIGDAVTPFLWQDLVAYRTPTPSQGAYLEASRQFGLAYGYSMPMRVPGEPFGVVSLATANNNPVPETMLPFATLAANAAFNRAREIVTARREKRREQVQLSPFELQCVLAAAQGKNDFVIARELNISEDAVAAALAAAQHKLGLTNRTSMIIKALQLGFFNFHQALIG